MICNTNKQISWQKISCYEYSFTNYTTKDVSVDIAGETNTHTKSFPEVITNQTVVFKLPSDGVYKITVNGQSETIIVDASEDVAAVETAISVHSFTGTEPIDFLALTFNGTGIYSVFGDGPSSTSSQGNITTALTTALGAGNFEIVGPGVTPSTFPELGTDATNWRLILQHPTNVSNQFITQGNGESVVFDDSPTIYCRYELANYTGSNNWITSFVIDGVDLMTAPTLPFRTRYDQTNAQDVAAFTTHVATYYQDLGFDILMTTNPYIVLVEDADLCCPDIEQITYAELTILCDPIIWCDYLYELCALHECVIKKVRDLMCQDNDPCKSDCTPSELIDKNKARQDALYMSTLFFHGIVPLIMKDRFNYMGDLTIDEKRIECTMKLKEVYEKLVDFATRCGECKETEEENDCGCKPNSTTKCNNC